jgi:flagellar motor protein MotB
MNMYRFLFAILFFSTLNSCTESSEKTGSFDKSETKSSEDTSENTDLPNANWRNPAMSPYGASVARIIRGYFLVGDYKKMLQFVIVPDCYERKQIEQIIRKSNWGYEIQFSNLQWSQDSTFILTFKTTKNNTVGSEQYVGKIVNDTAKIFLFPEKSNLFQYYGDENLDDPCYLKNALDNIYFEFDKSVILAKSNVSLNTIYNYLKRNSSRHAHFIGHSSNEGNANHNLTLSQERAKAICDFLVSKGISNDRLSYEGKGDKFPIHSNDTENSRSMNRRVELILSDD